MEVGRERWGRGMGAVVVGREDIGVAEEDIVGRSHSCSSLVGLVDCWRRSRRIERRTGHAGIRHVEEDRRSFGGLEGRNRSRSLEVEGAGRNVG